MKEKRFVTLLLAIAMMVSSMIGFTACSSGSSEAANGSESAQAAEEDGSENADAAAEDSSEKTDVTEQSNSGGSEDSSSVGGDNSRGAGLEGDRAAAEALIDTDVTMDEIESTVGQYGDFEMSSKGCERGVYAGLFYYDNFILHSRTYDKGQTFHVTAVNNY